MSKSYSLPTKPEDVIPSLIERFNSDKVSAMETLYEGAYLRANLQAATVTLPSDTLAKREALGTKSEQRPKEDI